MQYIKGKYLVSLLIITLTLYTWGLTGPLLDQAWAVTGVVSTSVANIRSTPVINNTNIVGTVNKNTSVEIISQSSEWYKVQAGNVGGWMNQSVLSIASSPLPTATVTPIIATAEPTPKVILDGQQMQFDVPPMIDSGRTLVPLAAIFRAMGATVSWNASTSTVTATKGDINIVLPIGSTAPTVNGKVWPLDVPAKTVNGRTLAPVRFVGEALGGTVIWNAATSAVTLTSPAQKVGVVMVNAETVNLRSGPDTSYNIVDTAHLGECLSVLGAQNGWYQVSRGGSQVWVAGWVVDTAQAGSGSNTATTAAATSTNSANTTIPAPANIQAFVQNMAPYAQEVCKATGLPVDFLLAQWQEETGMGTSNLATNCNNFGGIKDSKTGEYKSYATLEDFAQDVTKFYTQHSCFEKLLSDAKAGASLETIANDISASGYATAPGYGQIIVKEYVPQIDAALANQKSLKN